MRKFFDSPKPEDSVTIDKSDISAIANSRYFRKRGIMTLCLWAIVTLAIVLLTNYVSVIPPLAGYVALMLTAVIFVYFYSKGQSEVRTKLEKNMDEYVRGQSSKSNTEEKK